jgi:putative cofactor-binding repeat protein
VFQSSTSGIAESMTGSVVSGNELHAVSPHGAAVVEGAGFVAAADGPLTLRDTTVSGNSGAAQGSTGAAQGGGILDIDQSADGWPGGPLYLVDSHVSGNQLSGGPGIAIHGGGIYLTYSLSLLNSTVSGNVPDNCFGASC